MRIILMLAFLIFINQANAQESAAPAGEVSEGQVIEEKKVEKLWTHGSLMFDEKSLGWINEAIKSHDNGIPLEILLPTLFPPVNQAPVVPIEEEIQQEEQPEQQPEDIVAEVITKPTMPTEAPAFYLKSIMYFEPDNWAIWLNDQKITSTGEKDYKDVTVINVTESQVALLWKNTQIDLIYPDWQSSFTALDDSKYASPEKNIVVDSIGGNVSFILKPNQSLVSKNLSVNEGMFKAQSLTEEKKDNTAEQEKTPENTLTREAVSTPKPHENTNTVESLKNIEILKEILEQGGEVMR